jgi:hypothetical protein
MSRFVYLKNSVKAIMDNGYESKIVHTTRYCFIEFIIICADAQLFMQI